MAGYPGNWEHFLTIHFLISMNLRENPMFVHSDRKYCQMKFHVLLGIVHTTPEKFAQRSVISTVRPPVHTNPSQKRSFSKTLFKLEEFENAGFSFSLGRKTFWKRSISDNDVVLVTIVIMIWFPWPSEFHSIAHISKMTSDCCGFKFPRRSVKGRHLMRTRVKLPFLNSSGVVWTLNFRDIVVTLSPVNWVKRCS